MAPRWAGFPKPLRWICQALILSGLLVIISQSAYVLHTQSPEFSWEKTTPPPRPPPPPRPRPRPPPKSNEPESLPDCRRFPADAFAEDGIQVTLKIGGAESQERLRSHVEGATTCIPNLLVVSDMGQKLGPFHSHDVLADVIHVLSKEDQRAYQQQREYHYYWDKELAPTNAGWRLDRYKFLSMVEYAYAQNPSAKWYVFVETDTLVLWENLVQLLARYNSSDPLYLGSPTPGRDLGTRRAPIKTFFVYGGSGIVLSATAMDNLLREDRAGTVQGGSDHESQLLITKYQDMVREDCCGDSVLGWVAAQRDVEIAGLWPMFNPTPFHNTPLGRKYWCQPAVSFHKSEPSSSVELWKWAEKRQASGGDTDRPIIYSDLIEFFDFENHTVREDWKNSDHDGFNPPKDEAHASFESCQRACRDHSDCLQFTYHQKKCRLVRTISLGSFAEPDLEDNTEDGRWMAGWDIESIRAYQKENDCEKVDWPEPSTERIF